MTRVGIDIGGTFTDFVFADESGRISVEKEPSTPGRAQDAVRAGLARRSESTFAFVSHGTTIGVNAVLERKHAGTGLITTAGFRDVYEIGRHNRVEMYDLFYRKPKPLVERRLRLEVKERMSPRGDVLVALAEDDVRAATLQLVRLGVQAIAVVFLHAYANPAHEIRASQIINEVAPDVLVTSSHDIAREWREYERTSTTCINAYVLPLVSGYLESVEKELAERSGERCPLYISKSSGGLMTARAARNRPVQTIMSGPAGGATAAAYVGSAIGLANVIGLDMGGTSADVSLVHDRTLQVVHEGEIEGHPLLVPMIDITTIGAGGGSIAAVGREGGLTVGPQSAGASPGPACYGRGGELPTVTDANVVLGRIDPEFFLGGAMAIDADAAFRAVEQRVAKPLALDVTDAAEGIITIVNAKMAHAIRAVTVQRGLDPRDFTLLAFGGAGPLHACAVGAELGIPNVIIPPVPGVFSAFGMLASDLRYELARTFVAPLSGIDGVALSGAFDELRTSVHAALHEDGVADSVVTYELSADLRYVGQEHTLSVPVDEQVQVDRASIASIKRQFDELHQRNYGHASSTEPAEVVALRIVAIGAVPRLELGRLPAGSPKVEEDATRTVRSVYFRGHGQLSCRFINRDLLLAENRVAGPAVIEEAGSTTLVPPGFCLRVGVHGTLHISEGELE